MKKLLTSMGIVAALAFTVSTASAEEPKGYDVAGVKIANPLDASTWWDGSSHKIGDKVAFNPADPEFWMNFINPKMHSKVHNAIANPASWGQFMQPITYVNMFNLDTWKKWYDPKSYDVLIDPQTYAYWMQPGAFAHLVDFNHYAQIANPSAYAELANAGLNTVGYKFAAPSSEDVLSPTAWYNSISADTETVPSDS